MKELTNDICEFCKVGEIEVKRQQMFVANDCDCYECNGTGQTYLSDGVYGPCDCFYSVGPYFLCDVCSYCGWAEKNKSRKVTSGRVRAHLRLMIINKNKLIIDRIESMFTEGMAWSNRGEWHIDHIKPVKAFLDEGVNNLELINHHLNLQPLWASDNLAKGAKY
jgi:hypothetical protein